MPTNYLEIRKFQGLFLQANSFEVPDGAMEEAHNVILTHDNVISKIRGYYDYFNPGADTLFTTFIYDTRLLGVFADKIGYFTDTGTTPNQTGTRTGLTGETVTVAAPRIPRIAQANKNAYITTDLGVVKLESSTSNVYKAGAPPALDLRGQLLNGATNPLNNGETSGWRYLIGRRDGNSNLILGTPSDILQLANGSGGSRYARLELTLPSDITSADGKWFYQIYRSESVPNPGPVNSDFQLIKEAVLTSTDVTNGFVIYNDTILDFLRDNAAELYTNQNTREGEAQANARPPKCEDIVLYKSFMIYGNCTSRHLLPLQVVNPAALASGDYIEVRLGTGGTAHRYVARVGLGNQTEYVTGAGTTTITITRAAHGFSNGDVILVTDNPGGTAPLGLYTVSGVAANTFTITSTGNTAPAPEIQGVSNGTNYIFYLNPSTATADPLFDTAEGLVKAINRDPSSVVYANAGSPVDSPGSFRLTSKTFGSAIYVTASTSTVGGAFYPALTTATSDPAVVFSQNDNLPHAFYASKSDESEAVPLPNVFPVGARSKRIQRVLSLRDSLIIIKEDGVYRCTGDTIEGFSITLLDGTIFAAAANSAVVLNNTIYMLSNQGVAVITESAVQIISRRIEDVISPILGAATLDAQTAGLAYETERLYLLTTLEPNGTAASVTYVYNLLNESWTTMEFLFKGGSLGPGDVLYLATTADILQRERKSQTRVDSSGQNYPVTVGTVSSTAVVADIVMPAGVTPEVGDVVVKANVISRVRAVVFLSGTTYTVTFQRQTNLVNGDAVILYSRLVSTIKMAPFHAGQVGRTKQFSQMQLHTRAPTLSRLKIAFTNYSFQNSEELIWINPVTDAAGWGFFPWGSEPWGQEEGINTVRRTYPATPCRVYVPRFSQRTTYIQALLTHEEAAEEINIQALAYAVRAYQERVSV